MAMNVTCVPNSEIVEAVHSLTKSGRRNAFRDGAAGAEELDVAVRTGSSPGGPEGAVSLSSNPVRQTLWRA